MSPCSLTFLTSFFVLSAILAVVRWLPFRQAVLMFANAAFIASFELLPTTLVATAAFLLASWGLLALAARRPSAQVMLGGVAGAVLFLCVLKAGTAIHAPAYTQWISWTNAVGLSYMVFKFIHVLVDVSQGQVPRLSFATYLNYQLSFFTLTAGPINRYNEFEAAWNSEEVASSGAEETFSLWARIFSGVIKMGVIGPLLGAVIAQGADWLGPGVLPPAWLRPLLQFYLFPCQIYFDFSGYSDIAIGCARLLGFQLPENFNRPFSARNLIEFWDRWHMSLTNWLRAYFFMASYRFVGEHSRRHLRAAGYLLMGLSLVIFGLWHGFAAHYLLFGVVSGLGVMATRIWGDLLNARLGRAGYRHYLEHRGIQALAIVATFHFVCFSELFFALDLMKLRGLGHDLLEEAAQPWTAALLLKLALIPIGASLALLAYARWARADGTSALPAPTRPSPWRAYAPMALRASVIALFLIWQAVSQAGLPVGFYRTF